MPPLTRSKSRKISIDLYYKHTPQKRVRNVCLPPGWKWVGGGRCVGENVEYDFSTDDTFSGYNFNKNQAIWQLVNVMNNDDNFSMDIRRN
jgi:hypothetical protein